MKLTTMMAVIFFTAFSNIYAQSNADSSRLSQILQSYYQIKEALVEGNNQAASESATIFIKNLNGISYQIISEGNVHVLVKDAGSIADAKNIDKQRAAFANFSTNMAELAKGVKLTASPVYIQYCPMKKASWLSSEKAIKNPYYGSAMLTCGNIAETIQ